LVLMDMEARGACGFEGGEMLASWRRDRAFGEKVFDVIEAEPDRLREVDGIGPVRASRIAVAWAEQKVVEPVIRRLDPVQRAIGPQMGAGEFRLPLRWVPVRTAGRSWRTNM
jgi:hypothetical protein